jgi:hypothetical protein
MRMRRRNRTEESELTDNPDIPQQRRKAVQETRAKPLTTSRDSSKMTFPRFKSYDAQGRSLPLELTDDARRKLVLQPSSAYSL